MSAPVLFELESNRVRADHQTIEGWHRSLRDPADKAEAARLATHAANRMPGVIRGVWAASWDSAQRGTTSDYQETRQYVRDLFRECRAIVNGAQLLVDQVRERGVSIEDADRLPETMTLLQEMERKALGAWPEFNEAEAREAIAQCQRGEGKTPEEILRELHGDNPSDHP